VSKLLLEQGANARAATPDGVTALMVARRNGHEAVARLLQQHG
jgi:ankyrin repeat protein